VPCGCVMERLAGACPPGARITALAWLPPGPGGGAGRGSGGGPAAGHAVVGLSTGAVRLVRLSEDAGVDAEGGGGDDDKGEAYTVCFSQRFHAAPVQRIKVFDTHACARSAREDDIEFNSGGGGGGAGGRGGGNANMVREGFAISAACAVSFFLLAASVSACHRVHFGTSCWLVDRGH